VRHAEPTCPDFEAELSNTDLIGDDLSSIWMEASATIDDCCSLCDETEGCMGFVYFWQTCYLKGGNIGQVQSEGRVSRVRRSEPRCSDFEPQVVDADLNGELLSSVWMEGNATVDDCCPLCDETEGCVGFVYFEQTCHLKGGSSGTFTNVGRIVRMKSPCAGFQPAESDKDLAGDMLYDFPAQASEVCCNACAQHQDCQGFAFAGETVLQGKRSGGRCYLKTNVTGTFANSGAMASIKDGFPTRRLGGSMVLV